MGLNLTKFDFSPAYSAHEHTDPNSKCLRFPRGFVGEGLKVSVEPIGAEPWVGCFERIPTYSDLLFACPNNQHLYDARMDLRRYLRNVSDDGIKLDSLTADEVHGHRWSPASMTWTPFSIPLPSGSSDAVGSITS
jgi:hypothetical protein